MNKNILKVFFFLLAGIAVGVMFARFSVKDYRHVSVVLKEGAVTKPLYINDYDNTQVIALSLKNLQHAKNIELRMKGATVQSWYPPAVKMPFSKWMEVDGGKFKGITFGKRLPLYLIIDGLSECKELEIIDSSDGSIIQTVHVMKGGSDGGHH